MAKQQKLQRFPNFCPKLVAKDESGCRHLISAIAVFRYQNSRILDTNILHLIHGSVLSSVSVFAMSVRVHKLHFNKEVDGLIYKIIETEEEIKQCFELYQNSFLKGLMQ